MKQWLSGGFFALIALSLMTGCSHSGIRVETRTTTDSQQRVQVYESERGGPPPWAPAHGYRRKMAYHYYPDQEVYYNIASQRYTYKGDYGWEVTFALPSRISLGSYVEINLEGSHPEEYHHQVKTRYASSSKPGKGKPKDEARAVQARGNGKQRS